MTTMKRSTFVLLVFSTFPVMAQEFVQPDPTCGPPISRKEVTVFDAREFADSQRAAQFVLDSVGEVNASVTEVVGSRTAFGSAWRNQLTEP